MRPHERALQDLGKKEAPGNVWGDGPFGKKLHEAGQKDGEPYCAYACEVWYKDSLPQKFDELDKLFSASAVQTFKNFVKASYVIGELPAVDWLVIWQMYKNGEPQWQGHAGIVCSINPNDKYLFESVEANTTDGTKENRDGGVVARKPHRVVKDKQDGLRVLGFVKIV